MFGRSFYHCLSPTTCLQKEEQEEKEVCLLALVCVSDDLTAHVEGRARRERGRYLPHLMSFIHDADLIVQKEQKEAKEVSTLVYAYLIESFMNPSCTETREERGSHQSQEDCPCRISGED